MSDPEKLRRDAVDRLCAEFPQGQEGVFDYGHTLRFTHNGRTVMVRQVARPERDGYFAVLFDVAQQGDYVDAHIDAMIAYLEGGRDDQFPPASVFAEDG